MDITTPSGYTVVDTPLPYAILDTYVDEKYLSEEIDSLWANRQSYSRAIHAQKAEMRGFEKTLGEMLFTMKSILSKPGRGGGWSAWLKQRTIPIPRASADRIVQRFAATLPRGEELTHHATTEEPTEIEIGRLFAAVWPRCDKVLTTKQARYQFLWCVIHRSGLAYDWQDNGIMTFEPGHEPSPAVIENGGDTMHGLADDGDVL